MESRHNRAGVLLARHSRRIFCSTGSDGSDGEHSNSGNGGDHWSGLGPTARPSGRVVRLRPADVGCDRMKHVTISFTGDGPSAALFGLSTYSWICRIAMSEIYSNFCENRVA
jgi:hypothetical protein